MTMQNKAARRSAGHTLTGPSDRSSFDRRARIAMSVDQVPKHPNIRPESVVYGRDSSVIPLLLQVHGVLNPLILDACANKGVMWKKSGYLPDRTLDIDPEMSPDDVGDFRDMPYADESLDVI